MYICAIKMIQLKLNIMRTYIGFEIERNEYSGNIDWISPKMIIKHLSDSDVQTTIKGKRKITSVTNEAYDNALLSYNKTYDKIVDPFYFLFIPREEFNVLAKSFHDKCYQY